MYSLLKHILFHFYFKDKISFRAELVWEFTIPISSPRTNQYIWQHNILIKILLKVRYMTQNKGKYKQNYYLALFITIINHPGS